MRRGGWLGAVLDTLLACIVMLIPVGAVYVIVRFWPW